MKPWSVLGMLLIPALGAWAQEPGRPATPAVVNPALRSELGQTMSLDGEWDFAVDPKKQGEKEHWYRPDVPLPNAKRIRVPGCWEARGHRGYRGAAWYRRTVSIPAEWQRKRVYLKIGAVNAQGWFYVNGRFVGHLNTRGGSFKFDITDLVQPGRNATVAALVRNDVGSKKGLQNLNGVFGGLYRSVELEATPAIAVDDAWVETDFDKRQAKVHVILRHAGAPARPGELKLQVQVRTCGKPVRIAGSKIASVTFSDDDTTRLTLSFPLDPFRPWSPDDPQLYRAEIALVRDGQPIHGWTERFGARKWEVRGQRFFFNNRPFYMRAFGDDYVYPVALCSPADVDVHRKHLRRAREYGFNYVRLHTHVENPEYFAAADEMGILVQPEYYGFGYDRMTYSPAQAEETRLAMVEYYTLLRRHPSFATYCLGNESWIVPPHDRNLYRFIKKMDPTRLVLHHDGGNCLPDNSDFATSWGDKAFGRPWAFSYMEYNLNDKNNGHVETMPHVLHEFINAVVEYDPRLGRRYTGAYAPPDTMGAFNARVDGLGIDRAFGLAVLEAGYRMMSDVQKHNIEGARIVPWLDGYCYWTIVDVIYHAAQGLLDPFWQPKQSSPEFFRQFNGPSALLVRGLPDRPIRGRDGLKVDPDRGGVFVIAGQSNASGHGASLDNKEPTDPRVTMFGNDYRWKLAREPVDTAAGQLDKVSNDAAYVNDRVGHSFALRAAKDLVRSGVEQVKLIPCAKGGSRIAEWRMRPDPLDRSTLFGSMNARVRRAAPKGLTALWWHQGESDAGGGLDRYISNQTQLVREFRSALAPSLPIIYAQLAKIGNKKPSSIHHPIMEAQRRLETGSGYDCELARYHMVVTFDLPLVDTYHLTAEGQKELGRRFALASRQHVYGQKVDGTGPRLVALYHPDGRNDRVKIVFNQPITPSDSSYDGQFRAFLTHRIARWGDRPWLKTVPAVDADGVEAMTVLSAVRDPQDHCAVLVTLGKKATGLVLLSYGGVPPASLGERLDGIVKGANNLPAPAFGPLEVGRDLAARPNDTLHVQWVLSRFAGQPLRRQRIAWRLQDGENTLSRGRTDRLAFAASACTESIRTTIQIPQVKKATAARLIVELPGTTIRNEWPLWIFPARPGTAGETFDNVAATATLHRRLAGDYPGLKPYDPGQMDDFALLLADDVRSAQQAAAAGKRVLLIKRASTQTAHATFRFGWWLKSHQTGTALADHPAFGSFPHEGYLSPLLYRLINRAEGLGPAHRKADKLMLGHGAAGYQLYVYQTRVNRGRLLVTTLDLLNGTPEAQNLLAEFIDYARSDRFQPRGEIDLGPALRRLEAMGDLNGWSETVVQHHREQYDSFLGPLTTDFARFARGQVEVAWRTKPVPKDLKPDGSFTFKWAAALGWIAEPVAEFQLMLGDRKLLTFGVTQKETTWKSADGKVTLTFLPMGQMAGGQDSSGIMSLTVPADMLVRGEKALLRVRAPQTGSKRWFGLYHRP